MIFFSVGGLTDPTVQYFIPKSTYIKTNAFNFVMICRSIQFYLIPYIYFIRSSVEMMSNNNKSRCSFFISSLKEKENER